MNDLKAQILLMKCTGDAIWSVDTCRQEGIPESWIEELKDTFESGFDADCHTIYLAGRITNQYHGILDLQLAYKLAEFLGIDWQSVTATTLGKRAEVKAIQQALEEG